MRESISITTIFQIFILFVLLFTAIMALTINNSNAFGVKDSIVNAIEALDGNYTDGADLNEEIVKVIQETSYRTSGKCPDGYDGFDRAGNSVGSNSSDAAVCISEVDVTGGLDEAFSGFAQNDFVDGKYYKVVLFFQLDIPVFKQIFNFKTVGETRIIYNTIEDIDDNIIVDRDEKKELPNSKYQNQGNLDSREPTKGDDSGVNPVRNPGVSSSGGGTTTEEPVEDEEEETPQLTCNTEGLNLDTKLAGVQGVLFGTVGVNYGSDYGALYSDEAMTNKVLNMDLDGYIFTIQGTAAGDDTKWYISYKNNQCGWVNGKNLGIDFGAYASHNDVDVVMRPTNKTSSLFKVNKQNLDGVTGRALYTSEMKINPLQFAVAKKVLEAARTANKNNDTLVFYDTYRPNSVSGHVAEALRILVDSNQSIKNLYYGYNLSNFIAGNSSGHNRGCAVDVTIQGATMQSDIHELTPLAATDKNTTDANKLKSYFNGFKTLGSEWWHFEISPGGTCLYYDSDFWSAV